MLIPQRDSLPKENIGHIFFSFLRTNMSPRDAAFSLPHLRVQLLHAHEVDALEPVPVGRDEVEADVHAGVVVGGHLAADLQLLLEVA